MTPIETRARINRRAMECPDAISFAGSTQGGRRVEPAPSGSGHPAAIVISLADRRALLARRKDRQKA